MRTRFLVPVGLACLVVAAACSATGGTGSGGTGGATGAGGSGSTTSGGTGGATSTGTGGSGGANPTGGTGGSTSTTTTTGAGGMGTTSGTGGSGGVMCQAGSADCNNDPSDGCETNTFADPNNCGMCGNVCPGGANAPAGCSAGICTLVCPSGTGDCDLNPQNGCETNVKNDPNNCGMCGNSCMGQSCVQGACPCAAETKVANPVELDLYVMLDDSGSMSETVAGGATKWDAVTTALKGFINDPANAGVGVGLQYFPLSQPACPATCASDADCGNYGPCQVIIPPFGICLGCLFVGGDSCVVADYATPAVEIGLLAAAQKTKLVSSINMNGPTNNTPTGPALQGAINHAKAWAQAHPTHEVVVVLASDGIPTECDPSDIPSIANIAAAGVAGSPSIKTFVIGVGDAVADLNAIAVGGGTGSAFLVDTNANVVQQFEAALNVIQQSALGCEYTIPQPMGGMVDYNKVNVQYTPGGGASQLVGNVMNAAACGAGGGWYYDNNAMPTKIILCPATCNVVEADPQGKIDILLGCATQHQ
ncbi:MAG: VWA domain-containing protein [Byssovorax sp.]